MAEEKNRVTVTIRNKEYTIVAEESTDYILSVAKEFNDRISQVMDGNKGLNAEKVMILAALNLCDDYLKIRQTNNALQRQVMKCAKELEKAQETAAKQYEGDDSGADSMRKEILHYAQELKKAENTIRQMQKEHEARKDELAAIEKKHTEEIERLRGEYAQKEREILDMIDKL